MCFFVCRTTLTVCSMFCLAVLNLSKFEFQKSQKIRNLFTKLFKYLHTFSVSLLREGFFFTARHNRLMYDENFAFFVIYQSFVSTERPTYRRSDRNCSEILHSLAVSKIKGLLAYGIEQMRKQVDRCCCCCFKGRYGSEKH
jgi:hypothetical protein